MIGCMKIRSPRPHPYRKFPATSFVLSLLKQINRPPPHQETHITIKPLFFQERRMVAVTASVAGPIVATAALHHKLSPGASAISVIGLPKTRVRGSVRCSSEKATTKKIVGVQLAAAVVSTVAAAGPAMALVDERLSTEGTGLSLGLSNNLLGWILFGVFGLIWALYFAYTSTLEEDEESGLSL